MDGTAAPFHRLLQVFRIEAVFVIYDKNRFSIVASRDQILRLSLYEIARKTDQFAPYLYSTWQNVGSDQLLFRP